MQTTWFSLAELDGALPVDSGFPETVQANARTRVVCAVTGLDLVTGGSADAPSATPDVVESRRDLAPRPHRPALRGPAVRRPRPGPGGAGARTVSRRCRSSRCWPPAGARDDRSSTSCRMPVTSSPATSRSRRGGGGVGRAGRRAGDTGARAWARSCWAGYRPGHGSGRTATSRRPRASRAPAVCEVIRELFVLGRRFDEAGPLPEAVLPEGLVARPFQPERDEARVAAGQRRGVRPPRRAGPADPGRTSTRAWRSPGSTLRD